MPESVCVSVTCSYRHFNAVFHEFPGSRSKKREFHVVFRNTTCTFQDFMHEAGCDYNRQITAISANAPPYNNEYQATDVCFIFKIQNSIIILHLKYFINKVF